MQSPKFWEVDGPAARMLGPAAWLMSHIAAERQRRARPLSVPVPVLCVGNLVAGGAGKTPICLDLLARLSERGLRPFALTRGYGGRLKGPLLVDPDKQRWPAVGDEALLLARRAATIVSPDRVAGARLAVAEGAEVIVMDDGFQNPALSKDLSLVVVDGSFGFGNGRVIPAGPLREPLAAGLARADAVILLGEDRHRLGPRLSLSKPLLTARLEARKPEAWAGRRVFAFAGIGHPGKFFDSLARAGALVAESRSFADHHPFDPKEIGDVIRQARAHSAIPVTTEKDAVRLPDGLRDSVEVFAVEVAWDDPDALQTLLNRQLGHGPVSRH